MPPIALNASRDTLMFYTCNYNIRVTHRNGAIKHLLRIESTEGSSADCSLFILSLHALALHLAVKILLQIFLYEDLKHVNLTYICQFVFPSGMPTGPHFSTTNTIKWKHFLIFDINHQQNTRRVRPDWNDKNDNANYAPSYHMEGFTNGSDLPFLRNIRSSAERFRLWIVYSELKRHNVSHYVHLSSHR